MKKPILLIFVIITTTTVFSQNSNTIDFNRWSIETNVGLTKPYRYFSPGYYASTPDFFSGDFGVRYMFNEYFGLKSEFGYNELTNSKNSLDFKTDYYRFNLQFYANVGRVLKFESWTKTFNLLIHAGPGVGQFRFDNNPSATDNVGNFIGGATGQVKLSNRITLNVNASGLVNFRQNCSFDGSPRTPSDIQPSVIFNGTVGLSFNLGSKKAHADWYINENKIFNVIDTRINSADSKAYEAKIAADENQEELESLKKSITRLENQVTEISSNQKKQQNIQEEVERNLIGELIDGEYVNIYFDFNSTVIDKASISSVNFILNYLKKNPLVTALLSGYADEQGVKEYNILLSRKRAEAVKNLLVSAGIEETRLSTEGMGVDTNIIGGKVTNQLARRVSISLNNNGSADNIDSNEAVSPNNIGINVSTNAGVVFKQNFFDTEVKSIHFVEGKSYLTDYSKGRLNKLIKIINSNPDLYINMYAYTDGQSNLEKDKRISLARINSVTDYLLNNGVDESQIIRKESMGAVKPVATNSTEKGRLLNRRIEFELFKLQETASYKP